MNKKTKFLLIPFLILLTIGIFYSIVFASFSNILENTKVLFATNQNIYVDNKNLNKSFIVYLSEVNISNYKLYSKCTNNTKFVKKQWNYYVFLIQNFQKNCEDKTVYLKSNFWRIYKNTSFTFNLIKEEDLIAKYIDYSTQQLNDLIKDYKYRISKIPEISNFAFQKANYIDKLYMFRPIKEKQELLYKIKIIEKILKLRKNKYIIPIAWKSLPTRKDKLPNTWRWYRSHYTDWVHHGWDIDAPLWTPVIALDNWIIIRIIDWKWDDFAKIKYWKNLTNLDKQRNLNILRGKQVWLKTMKWDVVFYSHLENIPENLKEGDFVKAWTVLWEISITWVPDKTYNDYHLHFPIQKNPHLLSKAWKYTDDDYLMWDWLVKWMTKEEIIEYQNKIFNSEKNITKK